MVLVRRGRLPDTRGPPDSASRKGTACVSGTDSELQTQSSGDRAAFPALLFLSTLGEHHCDSQEMCRARSGSLKPQAGRARGLEPAQVRCAPLTPETFHGLILGRGFITGFQYSGILGGSCICVDVNKIQCHPSSKDPTVLFTHFPFPCSLSTALFSINSPRVCSAPLLAGSFASVNSIFMRNH